MTAHINAPQHLDPSSIEFAAFEKIRRIGPGSADGTTFSHNGIEYGLIVDTPCRLQLTHIVIARPPSAAGPGHMQAMAVLHWKDKSRHDANGLGLVMQALATGATVHEPSRPEGPIWRVLPMLPVPACYAQPDGSDE